MKATTPCFLLVLLALASSSWSQDFYIDPLNGNDANPGTLEQPKRNVSSPGLKSAVQPGDTIYLMDTAPYSGNQGMFLDGTWRDGTQTAPITIASAPGAKPVFKGCGLYQTYISLKRQWYVISGLRFEKSASACSQPVQFAMLVEGSNNTIRNCEFETFGIRADKSDFNLYENNVAVNIGDNGGGVGVGEFLTIRGGKGNTVQNNTIKGAGHAAIGVYDYPNLARLSSDNKFRNNVIDQGVGPGLNGGGGGIYVQVQSYNNLVEGNTIERIGEMVGITQPKAGIDITSSANIIRNNVIKSYGVPGNELHKGIYLNSTTQFNNKHADSNLFENNFIGAGFGLPIYIREGIGSRAVGVTVANNTFKNNTITAPINSLASSDYIGKFTPKGKYLIYLGSYQDGAWPVFANGNVFIDNNYVDDGTGLIGYFHVDGGFAMTVKQAQTLYPDTFVTTSFAAPELELGPVSK